MPIVLCFAEAPACSTTLDPTVDLSSTSGEAGAPGGDDLALGDCTEFGDDETGKYAICTAPLPWEAARHDFHLRGAHLAAAESAEENTLIAVHAAEILGQNTWLGASRDDSFLWTWETGSSFWQGGSDGTPVGDAYTRWVPGEPNNTSTVSTEQERCLALTLEGNDWNDRACSLDLGYACEWEQE